MTHDTSFRAALGALRRHFGFERFRPAQETVVRSVLAGRDVLAVLPTGAGKSLCFQLPALLTPGLTVVVSPLISLMEDQVAGAQRHGIDAACITSAMAPEARAAAEDAVREGRVKLVYVSPERLETRRFLALLEGAAVSRLVVDEAHCISEWGHDFRPSYRRIARFREAIGSPPASAFTATAPPRTRADIVESLRLSRPDQVVCDVDRPNLRWMARRVRSLDEGARVVMDTVGRVPGASIVYVATRRRAARLAVAFRRLGLDASPYHAGLASDVRSAVQQKFLAGRLRVVCATNAFGMGIDHPEIRCVCHLGLPGSLEAYVQEAGRAGRDTRPARCLLVACPGDERLQRAFAERRWPSCRLVARVWTRLPEGSGVAGEELAEACFPGVAPDLVASAVRLIVEFGGARRVWRGDGRMVVIRGPNALRRRIDFGASTRGRQGALRRQRAVRRYVSTRGCRRAAIAAYFEEAAPACRGCDRCGSPTGR